MEKMSLYSTLLLLLAVPASAFSPPAPSLDTKHHQFKPNGFTSSRTSQHYLFRNLFRKRDGGGNDGADEASGERSADKVPFFATTSTTTTKTKTTSSTTSNLDVKTVGVDANPVETVTDDEKKLSEELEEEPHKTRERTPLEKAEDLRAQAVRFRLEAEKMDIILTMEKIEKLEKELESNALDGNDRKKDDRKKDVIQQLESLKKKLNGETEVTVDASEKTFGLKGSDENEMNDILSGKIEKNSNTADQISSDETERLVEAFEQAPDFMKELVAKASGFDKATLNSTDVVLKMYNDAKKAPSEVISSNPPPLTNKKNEGEVPQFTQLQIDEYIEVAEAIPRMLKNTFDDDRKTNNTVLALSLMEEEWRQGKINVWPEVTQEMIDEKLEELKMLPGFLQPENSTELALTIIKFDLRTNSNSGEKQATLTKEARDVSSDGRQSLFGGFERKENTDTENMFETLFPKSTRKEEEDVSDSEINLVMTEIISKDKIWSASSKPEKVPGGYVIRGTTKFEKGNDLIENIDKNLQKSRIRDQVSIFYVFDPTPVSDEQKEGGDRPPVLLVLGSNVVRDPAPIQLSIVSAVAFGTIWYNSIFPYLLNSRYMKLAEEQLALADASMPSNLDFLNDASFPLFVMFIAIQLSHELAHQVVASANGMNITFPTLVPSLTTGLSGAVTGLKDPPKDKQALFDFAIAGPLTGMIVSLIMLFVGMEATVNMDAASYAELPALPLTLLRQSSLGGGIIDGIAPGLLDLPDTALNSKPIADINIPLSPFAIAGFIGLMINAINLLPVGRTDGGRIGLTLFGRSGTQLVALVTLIGMFLQGVFGSDIILYFFSFVIFFQSELEIPQRNEVDDMDYSRALLATATGFLVLLTLIPM